MYDANMSRIFINKKYIYMLIYNINNNNKFFPKYFGFWVVCVRFCCCWRRRIKKNNKFSLFNY